MALPQLLASTSSSSMTLPPFALAVCPRPSLVNVCFKTGCFAATSAIPGMMMMIMMMMIMMIKLAAADDHDDEGDDDDGDAASGSSYPDDFDDLDDVAEFFPGSRDCRL